MSPGRGRTAGHEEQVCGRLTSFLRDPFCSQCQQQQRRRPPGRGSSGSCVQSWCAAGARSRGWRRGWSEGRTRERRARQPATRETARCQAPSHTHTHGPAHALLRHPRHMLLLLLFVLWHRCSSFSSGPTLVPLFAYAAIPAIRGSISKNRITSNCRRNEWNGRL